MNKLFRKYIDDSITEEELKELRNHVSNMSDEELADWFTPELIDGNKSSSTPLHTKTKSTSVLLWRKVVLWAAAILCPILLTATAYLFFENSSISGQKVTVNTLLGEHSNVVLPDGSKVKLNANSQLSYKAQDFASGRRCVSFSGEGYFEVAKQDGQHFIVNGHEYSVEVKGTRFNIKAYDTDEIITVTLDKGAVCLYNTKGQYVNMLPGQVSTLDRQSGKFQVQDADQLGANTAWTRNELVIRQKRLADIQKSLASVYGIHFHNAISPIPDKPFTGTLPTNTLYAALEVLETAYQFHAEIHGTTVTIKK